MKYFELIEIKSHGSPDFPMQYYFVDKSHPQYIMPTHWHKEFEIIRVLEGELNLYLNNVEYCLTKGDILLVECGSLHRGAPLNCIYECIVFDISMLCQQNSAAEKLLKPIIGATVGLECLYSRSDSGIYVTLRSLFGILKEKNEYFELEAYGILFKLFYQLYCEEKVYSSPKLQHSNQAKTVTRLIDWIDKNYAEHISLDKLSALSGLSKKYLCRIFKEYTSKTLINYINELRIEKACYEIAVNGKSITEAAFNSGFNDLSYFSKTFKRLKGITPHEYKKADLK